MNTVKKANSSRRARRKFLAVAGVSACAVSAVLLNAAPASAESRGFTVTNNSGFTLRLEGLNRVHCLSTLPRECKGGDGYSMEFEGRPRVGSDIAPKGSQRFELKYGFSITTGVQYAAQLTYKIEHTNAKLEIEIWTTAYRNGSTCKVVPASAGTCRVADNTEITYTR